MRALNGLALFYFIFVSFFSLFSQEIDEAIGSYQFLENKGQWPNGVLYSTDVDGGKIWLEQGRVLYQFNDYSNVEEAHHDHASNSETSLLLKKSLLVTTFVGANNNVKTSHKYPSKDYFNYFLGNDESHWGREVRGYKQIKYNELYNKIDLLFFEKENDLKYEYHVNKGGDPKDIVVNYKGHKSLKINKRGSLIVTTNLGQVSEEKPYAYQIKNGKIIEVSCNFELLNKTDLTFRIGEYDSDLELVIDPVLIFATYCGSGSDNFGMTATFAYDGKGYSGGMVYGNAYPVPAPAWNTTANITIFNVFNSVTTDVFISKYSEDGTTMLWTNFIGGGDNTQGAESVHSLICDRNNNVYLYGATSSDDFPIINGFQAAHGGGVPITFNSTGTSFSIRGTDIFIAKFSADGLNLMGSTYVGGSGNDGLNYAVSAGSYPTGSYDSLTTNYGDQFRGEIMLDSIDNILITSSTRSLDFPTVSPFQAAIGGQQDAVIFKIKEDFSSLLFSSYYGGTENDAGYSVKIDSSLNIVFAGGTSSPDLPGVLGGFEPTYNGGKSDGYVAKLDIAGTTFIQSTFVGTDAYDQVFFVEIDRFDNIFIVGQSLGNMPISTIYSNPGSAQFIWKLDSDLTSTDFTTVFGNGDGTINISPSAFLVDVCGNIYVSGWGANIGNVSVPLSGMPVTADAFQSTPPNGFDFYLFVLERNATSILYGSYLGGNQADEHVDGGTSRFDKFGIVYQSVCGGCGGRSDFPVTPGAWSPTNDASNCNNLLFKFDFELIPVADFNLNAFEGCAPFTFELDNESNDTINSIWTFPPEATILEGGVNPKIRFDEPGTYEIIISITDVICNLVDTAKKVVTVYEPLQLEVSNDTVICASSTFDITANSNGLATSFIWSDKLDFSNIINNGVLDSVISVTPTSAFTYYVKASNGWPLCDLIDSVQVFFVDGALGVTADTSMCRGDSLELFATNLLPQLTTLTYDWSPDEHIIAENNNQVTVKPSTSMYFYVTATTNLGCTIIDSVWVNVDFLDTALIKVTATPDLIPEEGVSVLSAIPAGYSYSWEPASLVENPTSQTTSTVPLKAETEFTVAIRAGECSENKSVIVKTYEYICGDVYIYVPNGFSPNNDNLNDVLFVRGKNLIEIDFKIFDRWGELVFETADQAVGWDGTFKGKAVDPDVYKYHLRVVCFDEQESLVKGNITLIR